MVRKTSFQVRPQVNPANKRKMLPNVKEDAMNSGHLRKNEARTGIRKEGKAFLKRNRK